MLQHLGLDSFEHYGHKFIIIMGKNVIFVLEIIIPRLELLYNIYTAIGIQ